MEGQVGPTPCHGAARSLPRHHVVAWWVPLVSTRHSHDALSKIGPKVSFYKFSTTFNFDDFWVLKKINSRQKNDFQNQTQLNFCKLSNLTVDKTKLINKMLFSTSMYLNILPLFHNIRRLRF